MTEQNYFDLSVGQDSSTGRPIPAFAYHSPASGDNLRSSISSPSGIVNTQYSRQVVHKLGTERFPAAISSPQLSTTFQDFYISNDRPETTASRNPADRGSPAQSQNSRASTASPPDLVCRQIGPDDLLKLPGIMYDAQGNGNRPLILDIRSRSSYEKSRITGAINIAIPAILLKRPAYTIEKIVEALSGEDHRQVSDWKSHRLIVIYDNDSFNVGAGTPIYQVGAKFLQTGTDSLVYIIKGGYSAINREASALVDRSQSLSTSSSGTSSSAAFLDNGQALSRFSCKLPDKGPPIIPFFNNIRQNQDLVGGVGEPIAMQVPTVSEQLKSLLPYWLKDLAFTPQGPKCIADKFLQIEQDEQARMEHVLKGGTQLPSRTQDTRHSIAAGIERGDKNRYNNIWPFECARVKLKDNALSDYVNASHLHAVNSRKHYIATQGPLPGTTKDFWQVVWENEVSVIVMLTKTVEGGQAKCHEYWTDTEMIHPFIVEIVDETIKEAHQETRITTPMTIRRFLLSRRDKPLQEAKEVTQIQFGEWPDLHVIEPESILALVQEVSETTKTDLPATKRRKSVGSSVGLSVAEKPIITHCSAGCGRTGVFCTIDTVLDALHAQFSDPAFMAKDSKEDLVEKTVREFREQRISMVQTLRQFVLCYDAVLQYCIDHLEKVTLQN